MPSGTRHPYCPKGHVVRAYGWMGQHHLREVASSLPTYRHAGSKYSNTQLRTSGHWKAGVKSFPTVCDMPILSDVWLSYTVGKLLRSTFQPNCVNLRTSNVLSPGVLVPTPINIIRALRLKFVGNCSAGGVKMRWSQNWSSEPQNIITWPEKAGQTGNVLITYIDSLSKDINLPADKLDICMKYRAVSRVWRSNWLKIRF